MKKKSNLFKKLRYFRPLEKDEWSQVTSEDREWEKLYRNRWQYDKVVRTTHGVNCTGSCSWKIFVKDGIITWENQATDYPTTGPDMPEFEPRGCPRGASFSWYTYSPLRVKYPYIRGVLLEYWRDAVKGKNDFIEAWASIIEDEEKAKSYKSVRGKGGFVRVSWDEALEIISAQMIYTIKKYGPDRIAGFTPIPAMSMVSYAAGSRFLSLVGAPMLSFYDWYADLPPASPQVWGEQTDVPESSDWYNSTYLIMWGSNVPLTRTPDAHFMTEVRYKGTKIVSVSPDYAESVKFADTWLPINPGSDGALAQAMTHVILKEFYIEDKTDYFYNYAKKYTDLPYLLTLKKQGDNYVTDRFLVASDIKKLHPNAEWKTVVIDEETNKYVIPNGSVGHRWEGKNNWNLKMEDEEGNIYNPRMSILGIEDEIIEVNLPYFDDHNRGILLRSIPVKKIEIDGEIRYVTTVFDLMLANYGINRGFEKSESPCSYEDDIAYTPAWQKKFTGIEEKEVIRIAREFAQNAIDSNGRSMIIMGAGINHWFNADAIYRTILNLVILTGTQGLNGGGWAHYVGQEKVRPLEGWQTIAFARDWSLPPRLQNATSYFYFGTEQWRYEEIPMNDLVSKTVEQPKFQHPADYNYLAARLGWLPSYPQFDRNSLELCNDATKVGANSKEEIIGYVVNELKEKHLNFAIKDPDNPVNFPRTLFVWRANLISSSGKGHEYFLKHLLGASSGILGEESKDFKTKDITWHDNSPEGKLDLLVNLDFRMSGTALYSDIVLPAATWYEKNDISTTDMHPFIHPFNPAINPPWEAKTDWDIFKGLAKDFSKMAEKYLPEVQRDVVSVPLLHDSLDEIAQPFGKVKDWYKGEVEPIPGKTMPKLVIVERDYTQVFEKFTSIGPLLEKNPIGAHGVSYGAKEQFEELKNNFGIVKEQGISKGFPKLDTAINVINAILTLSSATNGKMALKAWEIAGKNSGLDLSDLIGGREAEKFDLSAITAQPRVVISTPIFSGTNKNRRYSPFTTNIERLVPFRTLSGRQHFYNDHELMLEFGEGLPIFKPTLPTQAFAKQDNVPDSEGKTITLRYLTPHGKWNIHSTYGDTLNMLTLFRGGPNIWLNNEDAKDIEIKDNDWIEVFNRHGVVVVRAVVSHRIPRGTSYMYHSQDKTINTPGSELTNLRGGTHNSPTRIHLKPTHCIGGYAQFSYGFNYYGPTGNQRDLKVIIRKLKEVIWLED
ncbi:MAG: nitrate reductase subunit alpha [Vulcanibacillus sp.]